MKSHGLAYQSTHLGGGFGPALIAESLHGGEDLLLILQRCYLQSKQTLLFCFSQLRTATFDVIRNIYGTFKLIKGLQRRN